MRRFLSTLACLVLFTVSAIAQTPTKQDVIAMNLAAVTASQNGPDISNLCCNSAQVIIDITTITGTTPTATFTVQGKDPASNKYYTILASTALNATGTTVLRIGRGMSVTANLSVSDIVPSKFRVILTTGGTVTNLTATVGAVLSN